ncbi:MAG: hypothetical protein DBX48_08785 [Limosilactobacillus fermentum]|mgnify:CR=1 FL=1|nr:MAG: hypothetical protein DBX48_08785 [Limosilactobacillus fermentum]
MKKLRIVVSLRESVMAIGAIHDFPYLKKNLKAVASDVWESKDFDDEEDDKVEELKTTVEEQFDRCEISEFSIYTIDPEEE